MGIEQTLLISPAIPFCSFISIIHLSYIYIIYSSHWQWLICTQIKYFSSTDCEHSPGQKHGERMVGGGEIEQNKGSAEAQEVFKSGYKNSSTSSVKGSAHTADPTDCSSLAHIHQQNVLTHEFLTKNSAPELCLPFRAGRSHMLETSPGKAIQWNNKHFNVN